MQQIVPGAVFGLLTVLELHGKSKSGRPIWLCRCRCGKQSKPWGDSLLKGATTSCGCDRYRKAAEASTVHGLSRHSAANTWYHIVSRCNNPENSDYKDYGGRGIKLCERWENLENFIADMGERPKGYSIERLNNDLGYEPGNCVWADNKTQARNKRTTGWITFQGETKSIAEWSELTGINYSTIRSRRAKGLSPAEILDSKLQKTR